MFSTPTDKLKLPSDHAPTLRCLLNGPFRDLHFAATDHRSMPVHDVVFLDEIDNANVKPLIYRSKPAETVPVPASQSERIAKRYLKPFLQNMFTISFNLTASKL